MYYNANDLANPNMEVSMLEFLRHDGCYREFLMNYFGFEVERPANGDRTYCCSFCCDDSKAHTQTMHVPADPALKRACQGSLGRYFRMQNSQIKKVLSVFTSDLCEAFIDSIVFDPYFHSDIDYLNAQYPNINSLFLAQIAKIVSAEISRYHRK